MPEFRSYRRKSREIDWGADGTGPLSIEQLNCGALLRIADALEKMAQPYRALLDEADWQRRRVQDLQSENVRLFRRNAGLRGHIGQLKKRGSHA